MVFVSFLRSVDSWASGIEYDSVEFRTGNGKDIHYLMHILIHMAMHVTFMIYIDFCTLSLGPQRHIHKRASCANQSLMTGHKPLRVAYDAGYLV